MGLYWLAIRQRQNIKSEAPSSSNGHSTCTASKAAGNIFGAARYATLVVVKMPDFTLESVLESLWTVYDHVKRNNRGDRSVLLIPWGSIDSYRSATDLDPWAQEILRACKMLNQLGVVVVSAAGNFAQTRGPSGLRTNVDTVPAIFGAAYGNPLFLAVGNSDNYGKRYPTSQTQKTSPQQILAPGVNVRCADSTSTGGSHLDTGTSYCKATLSCHIC